MIFLLLFSLNIYLAITYGYTQVGTLLYYRDSYCEIRITRYASKKDYFLNITIRKFIIEIVPSAEIAHNASQRLILKHKFSMSPTGSTTVIDIRSEPLS